jgi:tripartite-type tricarboxylate transporter receptor subunit TctC
MLPGLPTISESGVPGYQTQIWFGVFAPKSTPANLVASMHGALNEALVNPEVIKRLDDIGVEIEKMTTAQFARLMESEQDKWARVIKQANIRGE